jgi:hypothetical protein
MNARKSTLAVSVGLLGVTVLACALPTNVITPPTNTPGIVFPTARPADTQTPVPSETVVPSTTPTITLTPSPAPTSTSTPNPRLAVNAIFLSTPPTIDGPWDDWTTTQLPIPYVVFGAANWSGSDDLRGSYRVGWDSKYLYLAVKVIDDLYVQNAQGANLYKGDSIEVIIGDNPNGASPSVGMTATDFQVGISPGRPKVGENMEAYLFLPSTKAGNLPKVLVGAEPMSNGYRLETAIPWSTFAVTPAKGLVLGFVLSVSDNDNPDKDVQQSLFSTAPKRVLNDPTTWGLLTLK